VLAAPGFSGEFMAGCGCVRFGGFGFWVGRRRAFEAGHSARLALGSESVEISTIWFIVKPCVASGNI
jgi:hypothetical protein